MASLNGTMASAKDWLEGARLRTLPAAAAPVFVGSGAAYHLGAFSWGMSALALGVALLLQIGVNFANDYSDGVRGTDDQRTGPKRLTASGAVSPRRVLSIAFTCFALAALFGLILIEWSGHWWLVILGFAAIVAAWFYTGGRNPYGYAGVGLSELFVFIFFGLMATVGTTYVQTSSVPWWLWVAASGIGFISVALLMVNNIRDVTTDALVGKRTLVVRLGETSARWVYASLIIAAVFAGDVAQFAAGASPLWALAVAGVLGLAGIPGLVAVLGGAKGRLLLGALRNTGLYALTYGVVMGGVFALGAGNIL